MKYVQVIFALGAIAAASSATAANRPSGWVTICSENATCSVPANTNVAFGRADQFYYKVLSGTFVCKRIVKSVLGGDPKDLEPYVYVGDALNDEPMFKGFPRSVGVANVRGVWDELVHKPAFVTDAAEGAGFEELAAALSPL